MLPVLSFESVSLDNISGWFNNNIHADVLRLDKISPHISGNKWFKLRYYLDQAKSGKKKGILTFGGAWSNHIVATAAACKAQGLESAGIIRGEEPNTRSLSLQDAVAFGMKLHFISRDDYKLKKIPCDLDTEQWLLVDEGGYGPVGAAGAATILDYSGNDYTHYCCAVGTGTMMAGLVNRAGENQHVTGVSVMKGNYSLENMLEKLLVAGQKNWRIVHDYAFGGYAKYSPDLISFMNSFYAGTGIPTDFVYTAKLFFAIKDLADHDYFPLSSKLLIVHSGGLQGNRSLPRDLLSFAQHAT